MKTLTAQKVSFDICEFLGEGLTSQVYKAFRKDPKGYTRQEVALKILKSKKHVQVLKTEFEKLIQVDSKYCVKVLAWESLSSGSALVLEYIEGVSLEQLLRAGSLDPELIEEVRVQVSCGLRSLHRANIIHGDLNLKNILITKSGLIKLIDFGFFDLENQSYFTPEFAEPNLLKGASATRQSDFYALKKIVNYMEREHLLSNQLREIKSSSKQAAPISRGWRRRALAQRVSEQLSNRHKKTQILTNFARKPKVSPTKRFATFVLSSLIFLLIFQEKPTKSTGLFQVKGYNHWVQFSLNKGHYQYGPTTALKLRTGQYNVSLQSAKGQEQRKIRISQSKTFLLQP